MTKEQFDDLLLEIQRNSGENFRYEFICFAATTPGAAEFAARQMGAYGQKAQEAIYQAGAAFVAQEEEIERLKKEIKRILGPDGGQ